MITTMENALTFEEIYGDHCRELLSEYYAQRVDRLRRNPPGN